jgi:hypothetical protein
MMTKNRPSHNYFSRKIVAVILFSCIGSAFTFSQENKSLFSDSKYENEWWFPLIKKHNIDPKQFTFWSNIKSESGNATGYTALELGKDAFINDTILTIKDPIFIIKENEEEYNLVIAESASHDLRISQIKWENGKVESFKFKATLLRPTQSLAFGELQMDTKTKKTLIKMIRGVVYN